MLPQTLPWLQVPFAPMKMGLGELPRDALVLQRRAVELGLPDPPLHQRPFAREACRHCRSPPARRSPASVFTPESLVLGSAHASMCLLGCVRRKECARDAPDSQRRASGPGLQHRDRPGRPRRICTLADPRSQPRTSGWAGHEVALWRRTGRWAIAPRRRNVTTPSCRASSPARSRCRTCPDDAHTPLVTTCCTAHPAWRAHGHLSRGLGAGPGSRRIDLTCRSSRLRLPHDGAGLS